MWAAGTRAGFMFQSWLKSGEFKGKKLQGGHQQGKLNGDGWEKQIPTCSMETEKVESLYSWSEKQTT